MSRIYNKSYFNARKKKVFAICEWNKVTKIDDAYFFITSDLKILYDFLQPARVGKKNRKILSDEHGRYVIEKYSDFLEFFPNRKVVDGPYIFKVTDILDNKDSKFDFFKNLEPQEYYYKIYMLNYLYK